MLEDKKSTEQFGISPVAVIITIIILIGLGTWLLTTANAECGYTVHFPYEVTSQQSGTDVVALQAQYDAFGDVVLGDVESEHYPYAPIKSVTIAAPYTVSTGDHARAMCRENALAYVPLGAAVTPP